MKRWKRWESLKMSKPTLSVRQSSKGNDIYEWRGTFEERVLAEEANFTFRKNSGGVWYTKSPYRALKLIDYATPEAYRGLLLPLERIEASKDTVSLLNVPIPTTLEDEGGAYIPFQKVGVENSIRRWEEEERTGINLLADEMGVGKTIQALGVSNATGAEKVLVICPASIREKWAREMAKWRVCKKSPVAIVSGPNYQYNSKLSHVVSYEGAVNTYDQLIEQQYDHIIVDECFPYHTPVITNRGELSIGDVVTSGAASHVLSYDFSNNVLDFFPIARYIKNTLKNQLLRITHTSGDIVCTANHKIWTDDGYKKAENIKAGDNLRVVRRRERDREIEKKKSSALLLKKLFRKVEDVSTRHEGEVPQSGSDSKKKGVEKEVAGNTRRHGVQEEKLGENEKRQPRLQSGYSREDKKNQTEERYTPHVARHKRGKRNRRHRSAVNAFQGFRLAYRSAHTHWHAKRLRVANMLQDRCGQRGIENSNRSRWEEPPDKNRPGARSKKDRLLRSSRVVSVEILEQRSYGGSKQSEKDSGFVYNIEVEKTHNYFASGVLVSNCHYLKNPDAQRTQKILGATYTKNGVQNEGDKGIIEIGGKVDLLSGTIIPNRPNEFHPILRRCAPDAIDYVGYWRYLERFCKFYNGDHGVIVTGTRNEWELYNRLRGSGFMTRRLKKEVLPQLPDKAYNLVYFPVDSRFAKIIEKEKAFSIEEIKEVGGDVNKISGLPEVRREMGEAKVPIILQYVDMLLKTVDKVLVGAWHKTVIEELYFEWVKRGYNPAGIYGATVHRQAQVDMFQREESCRVFIGQLQAAGEGHDLTASSQVVLAEPDWAPMRNNQFIDRLHRIGQTEKVTVHMPVVENSLDAKIFSVAADKQWGSDKILDGE